MLSAAIRPSGHLPNQGLPTKPKEPNMDNSLNGFSCFLFHSTLEFYFGDVHFLFPKTKATGGMIIPTVAPSTGSWLGMYRVISQLQMELVHLTKQTYSTFTKLVFLKLHPCETPSVASQGFFTQKCQLGTLNTSHPVVFLGAGDLQIEWLLKCIYIYIWP